MQAEQIKRYLTELDAELGQSGARGEICLYGGAVMCLVYKARGGTKDVDAIFEPTRTIRQAAEQIAQRHGLRPDWLNDAVKGFVVPHDRQQLYTFDHLKVFVPDAEYLLAMKCLAARADAADREDVRFLINHLKIQRPEDVFAILAQYYPHERIKPSTRFFIEELMEGHEP